MDQIGPGISERQMTKGAFFRYPSFRKCLLLSYVRVGDNSTAMAKSACQTWMSALPFHEKAGRCQEAFVFE
jgi:hypothetical protein